MGDMGGGGVKNLKKVRDVLCERPLMCNKIVTLTFLEVRWARFISILTSIKFVSIGTEPQKQLPLV